MTLSPRETLPIRKADGTLARVGAGDRVRLTRDTRWGSVKAGTLGTVTGVSVFGWAPSCNSITVRFPYHSEQFPQLTEWDCRFDWPCDMLEAV